MLRSLHDLEKYQVSAKDGDIGHVSDFLFDDQHWRVRYLVVDTGGFWHGPHRVLISPIAFRQADWSTRRFHLALTQDKVRNSPSVDLDGPVSRQYEQAYFQYYGWPYWGMEAYPAALIGNALSQTPAFAPPADGDPHLRSVQEVARYDVQGCDAQIGHVTDFIVDDETWTVRYLAINTSSWWFGKKVLVAPRWAREVSAAQAKIYLNLRRETVLSAPAGRRRLPLPRPYRASASGRDSADRSRAGGRR